MSFTPNSVKKFSAKTKLFITLGMVLLIVLPLISYQVFGSVTFGVTIVNNPDLENGLLAYYTFDGVDFDSGSTTAEVLDRVGGNNGDASGGGGCGFGSDIGGGECQGYITSGSTWNVPSDWNSSDNTIEAIGAGGRGGQSTGSTNSGAGGGGGEYRAATNVSLTAGMSVGINIPSGGDGSALGGAWMKDGPDAGDTKVIEAKNGGNASGVTAGSGGTGGTGAAANYDGGAGGAGASNSTASGGGGGGSAGPTGAGKAGGDGVGATNRGAGGGGGSNGGSSSAGSTASTDSGGAGGNGTDGTGGGTAPTTGNPGNDATSGTGGGGSGGSNCTGSADCPGGNGAAEDLWGTGVGPSGGGGGGGGASGTGRTGDADGGNGGAYGGGGGGCGVSGTLDSGECDGSANGGQGLIVVTYAPASGDAPDLTPGAIGQAMEFDGVDDFVDISGIVSGVDVAEGSMSAWVYTNPNDFDGDPDGIVTIGDANSVTNTITLMLSSTENFELNYQVNSVSYSASTSAADYANRWAHLVSVWDANSVYLYLDGELVSGPTARSGTITGGVLDQAFIGTDAQSGQNKFFAGKIDDVRIYDRIVSAEEAKRLYQLGATTKIGKTLDTNSALENGLVGHWTFDHADALRHSDFQYINDVSKFTNSSSYDFSSQLSAPTGMYFKSDGKTMYISGESTDSVYQYSLSIPWSVESAAYTGKNAYLGSQDIYPHEISFSTDGTKMYMIGANTTDRVYQYTLSTAWDVSSASYASKNVSVNGQESSSRGLTFSADGTKMYVCGTTNDTVYQYTLSTAWDVSSASYASKSKLVSSEGVNPNDVDFNSDGSRMYVVDGGGTVFRYTLSTAWDVSTASYDSISYSANGKGLAVKGDETVIALASAGANTAYDHKFPLPIRATGKLGQALEFDGVDDEINLGDVDAYEFTSDFSVSAWFNTDDLTSSQSIFSKGCGSSNGYDFGLEPTADKVRLRSNSVSNTGNTALEADTWYHITYTVDSSSDLRIYVNGVLDNTPTSVTINNDATADVEIGSCNSSTRVNGKLDDVRLYDRTLSQEEITRLYQLGATTHIGLTLEPQSVDSGSLVGHWTFDGKYNENSSLLKTLDSSGNSNTAELYGEDNLVLYWSMDAEDINGSTITNRSTYGSGNGTISGATASSTSIFGEGRSFDGVNDNITTANNFGITNANFTLATWVYLDSTSESGAFIKLGSGANGVGIGVGGTTFDNTGNDLVILYEAVRWIDTNDAIGTGWHHVALVVNASGKPTAYIDGVATYSDSSTNAVSASANLYVGGYTGSLSENRFVDAELDDVRIYNRALTGAEIGLLADGRRSLEQKYKPGKNGQAVDFDGVNDFLDVSSVTSSFNESAGTISAWIYVPQSSIDGVLDVIFEVADFSTNDDYVSLRLTAADELALRYRVGAVNTGVSIDATGYGDSWVHLVGTWDSDNQHYLYVNGDLVDGPVSRASTITDGLVDTASIGTDATDVISNFFEGKIDDVRLYDQALTADEVKRLYESTGG